MTAYLPLLAVVAVLLAVSGPTSFRAPRRIPPLVPPPRGVPRRRRRDELAWVEALVAELAGGRDPVSALVAASASYDVCPGAVAAARGGGDVATALRAGDASPLVRGVAACWEVAHGSGAGLASSLATLADAARETERVRGELRAGLAEPRATALVLATLPLLGLLLGSVLGAEPWRWLLGSAPGHVVLALGVGLEGLGTWWAWRITVSLEAGL